MIIQNNGKKDKWNFPKGKGYQVGHPAGKKSSPSGNRTRASRMGICHSTTKLTETY